MQVYEFSDLVTDAGVGVLTLNADTMTTQLLCKHVLLDHKSWACVFYEQLFRICGE